MTFFTHAAFQRIAEESHQKVLLQYASVNTCPNRERMSAREACRDALNVEREVWHEWN